jgi:hypothetical protein
VPEGTRKIYDKEHGELGMIGQNAVVVALKEAGIEVLGEAGKTIPDRSPFDILCSIHGNQKRLQIEKRFYDLDYFSTVHLPDESLNFDLLIEISERVFITSVDKIKASPMVVVPNKAGGDNEKFYDIPKEAFQIFSSLKEMCEWL